MESSEGSPCGLALRFHHRTRRPDTLTPQAKPKVHTLLAADTVTLNLDREQAP